ncbi:phosphate-transport permease PitB [Streptococcus pneumoniae]|nr:phosphate-transport permease PitB [Streptococcus pneumoniae]
MIIMKKENKKIKGTIMKKTFFKKLFTASIAAITALSVFRGVPTFADDNSATAKANGETNAKVAINKTLNIAEGITTPKATFKFTFTPKVGTSSNQAPYQVASTTDKSKGYIPERKVAYNETDQLVSGQLSIKKDTGNIFDGVSYDHAGEYVYTVAETQNTYTPIKDKNEKEIDAIKYDIRTYDMHVIVKNKGTNGTYIYSVYFKENNQQNPGKVKPSLTGEVYKYDLFDNTYTKDAGKVDPNDPHPNKPEKGKTDKDKKSLTITKIVDGASGDRTKAFNFQIHIELPSTNKTAASPMSNIVVKHGETSHELAIVSTSTSETVDYSFTLKHNETFTIDNLPAGSKYTVKETGVPGYTASASYLENGVQKSKAGVIGTEFSVENILVGEKTNNNTVTNKINDVTPTGLLIDNLPFILIIGLGLAGFVVLSKKRREA